MTTEYPPSATDLPADVQAMIGQPMYEEQTEFPIEQGYVLNTCAASQNANPLYWQAEVAQELTGGPIAPPTMLSVWFRPHYWAPGATGERTALMTHFDLKRLLELPEATKLGRGRFWTIDVETVNQRGEWVGTDTYTCLGYRKPGQ